MWLVLGLGELYILGRHYLKLLFYASETAFFQGALAHAAYTAAPAVVWPESPAAEAIANADHVDHGMTQLIRLHLGPSGTHGSSSSTTSRPTSTCCKRVLERAGFSRVESTSDPREASDCSSSTSPI